MAMPRTAGFRSINYKIVLGLLSAGFPGILMLFLAKTSQTAHPNLVNWLIPGIIVSVVLSGNVHAPPGWIVIVVNVFFYFGLGWLAGHLIRILSRR